MSPEEAESIETSWARLRVREALEEAGYVCIVDRSDRAGSWRAEFHREADENGAARATWALKPAAAPYVSVGLVVALPRSESLADLEARTAVASEHDLALTARDDGGLMQLSTRVPITGLESEGLALHIRNLEVAQEGLLDLVHDDARAEGARRVEIVEDESV